MVEKVLHGVNVAACCGQLATAAVDIASTGGLATTISAGLSALALRRSPNAQAELADLCLQALHAHIAQAKLVEDVQKQILLMLDSYLPGKAEFAQGDMRADKIAKLMHDRIIDQSRVAEFKDVATLEAYEELLTETLDPLLAPRTQSEANEAELLQRSTKLDAKQDVVLAQNAEIMNLLSSQIAYPRLYEAGLSEEAILGQIRRVSEHTNDPQAALADLEVALTRLANFEADANRPSNHSSQIDTAVAQAGVLVNQDRLSDARALLADQRERAAAEMQRLLSKEIDVALIDGDAAGAAALIVEQADHDAGGRADFAALRQVQEDYYVVGRDKGVALDLRVSIALAKLLVDRAGDSDETRAALNDLGIALQTLGKRDRGTKRLKQAVEAYQLALKGWTRDRAPLDWAGTQNNLGTALQTLGECESDTDRLEQAVEAFQQALKEYTRDEVPLGWAATQNNLGNALATLGERDSDTDRLEQAVEAFQQALKEYTRDEVPLGWAATQNNLGNALATLGERDSDTDRLEQAVEAFQQALKEYTRDEVPLGWAATQNNLGNALATLGERDSDTDRLEQAVEAFQQALKERTRDRVPLNWAGTQHNLAHTYLTLFEKTAQAVHLDRAQDLLRAAAAEFAAAGASHYADMAACLQAKIDAARSAG